MKRKAKPAARKPAPVKAPAPHPASRELAPSGFGWGRRYEPAK